MKILKYPTLLLLYCFVFFQTAKAYDIGLSLGNLCEYIGKIQTTDTGETNVCSFNPYIGSSFDYLLKENFILASDLSISFPKKGRDENISKLFIFALISAKYKWSKSHFTLGTGFFFTRISGDGGTEDLNNANSTVSFPLPENTIYSRNFILKFGSGIDFDQNWSMDINTFIFNIINSKDRAFSLAINGTYHFGEF